MNNKEEQIRKIISKQYDLFVRSAEFYNMKKCIDSISRILLSVRDKEPYSNVIFYNKLENKVYNKILKRKYKEMSTEIVKNMLRDKNTTDEEFENLRKSLRKDAVYEMIADHYIIEEFVNISEKLKEQYKLIMDCLEES